MKDGAILIMVNMFMIPSNCLFEILWNEKSR